MSKDVYHLTIYWITTTDTGNEKTVEQGNFPVRVRACNVVDAYSQVLVIANRMSEAFKGTDTDFFYHVDL